MADFETHQKEVDRNYKAFKKMLPDLMREDKGKYALMKNRRVELILDTAHDAYVIGERLFPDGIYSIQQITDEPIYM